MVDAKRASGSNPVVSVIMAFYNAGPYLEEAIASVLSQSITDLELILSDDASFDGSRAVALRAAERDPRVRVVSSEVRGGPAQARNRALDMATGDWVAVVDADDLLHPARFDRLIAQATMLGVDMVADDLIYFGGESGKSLLDRLALARPWLPDVADLLRGEAGTPPVSVGYLKPVMRRRAIGMLRYRPYLTVGEDFDLLLRLRLAGARLAILPEAYYLYRRHGASISHRLSELAARNMVRALDELREEGVSLSETAEAFFEQRRANLLRQADFAHLVALVKSRSVGRAMTHLGRYPALLPLLAQSASEHVMKRLPRPKVSEDPPALMLVSEDDGPATPNGVRRIAVPERAADWNTSTATNLTAAATLGNARLRVVGRAGLEALGYVPGWSQAELIAPLDQWTKEEQDLIAALPWPVTHAAGWSGEDLTGNDASRGSPSAPVAGGRSGIDANPV